MKAHLIPVATFHTRVPLASFAIISFIQEDFSGEDVREVCVVSDKNIEIM
jgi:hypothetical protein